MPAGLVSQRERDLAANLVERIVGKPLNVEVMSMFGNRKSSGTPCASAPTMALSAKNGCRTSVARCCAQTPRADYRSGDQAGGST